MPQSTTKKIEKIDLNLKDLADVFNKYEDIFHKEQPTGLKWEKIEFNSIPKNGIELNSDKLKTLLNQKIDITQVEFDDCNIKNLKAENYIKISHEYYMPISEELNYLKWENIGNDLPSTGKLEKNPELELALENKTIFTEQEILNFGIRNKNLKGNFYVKSQNSYFKPVKRVSFKNYTRGGNNIANIPSNYKIKSEKKDLNIENYVDTTKNLEILLKINDINDEITSIIEGHSEFIENIYSTEYNFMNIFESEDDSGDINTKREDITAYRINNGATYGYKSSENSLEKNWWYWIDGILYKGSKNQNIKEYIIPDKNYKILLNEIINTKDDDIGIFKEYNISFDNETINIAESNKDNEKKK